MFNRIHTLPCASRQYTIGPPPNSRLAQLIQNQNTEPERRWQEIILGGDAGRSQCILQCWDIQPEGGHTQRKHNGWEQQEILGLFVECWRMREDAEPACADGHEVEPLPKESSVSILEETFTPLG